MLSPKLLFFVLLAFGSAGTLFAQNGPPPEDVKQEFAAAPAKRPNLLESLGLSKNQIRQIRVLNRERKPQMEAAQQRMREANRALDMAIYADGMNEADVSARLKDFQDAQADVARIRFHSELSIRKVLTPDQLVRFRGLRARVAETRQNNIQQRRQQIPPGERPLQRLRQLPRQGRNN